MEHFKSVHEGEKPFKCEKCEATFTKRHTLDLHVKSFHDGIKPFMCNICSYCFPQKSDLKKHIKQVHEGKQQIEMEVSDLEKYPESVHDTIIDQEIDMKYEIEDNVSYGQLGF